MPVARRALGESNETALGPEVPYCSRLPARGLGCTATLDGLREAVATLEDAERIARRVFGGAHPLTGMCPGRPADCAGHSLRAGVLRGIAGSNTPKYGCGDQDKDPSKTIT